MAKLLLIDVEADIFDSVRVVECNSNDDYDKYLKCSCFDIGRRKVGDTYYDIFVDDTGLLKDNPVVSAVTSNGEPMLVGNLIFANHDAEGETISLSLQDMDNIIDHTFFIGNPIVICDY